MKKILMIGNFTTNYIRDCWLEPMRKLYDVVYVSAAILFKEYSKDEVEHYIYEVIRRNEIHSIFIYSDGLKGNLTDQFFENLKKNYFVFAFHADDEPEKWYKINEKYDGRYHYIFTHSLAGHNLREERPDHDRPSSWLPWGYNPDIYYKIPDIEKDIDVLFVGTNKFSSAGIYYEEGEERQRLIVDVYDYCRKNGYIFKVYGLNWDRHPVLAECWGGYLDNDELSYVINRSRIVLNFGMSSDGRIDTYQTKIRHYEIGGCDTFQITNENPELREQFGDNIGFFSTKEELTQVVAYHLEHKQETERKAAYVYSECTQKHSMENRIKTMMQVVECKSGLPIAEIQSPRESKLGIFRANGKQGLKKLLDGLRSGQIELNHDYYVIIDSKLEISDINESLIYEDMRKQDRDILTIGTMLAFVKKSEKRTQKNIRRFTDQRAQAVLPYNKDDTLNNEFLKQNLNYVCFEGGWMPLIDFVIKRDHLETVLNAALSQGDIYRNHYSIKDTKMVVNDFTMYTDADLADKHIMLIMRLLDLSKKGRKIAFYGYSGYMYDKLSECLCSCSQESNVIIIDKYKKEENAVFLYHNERREYSKCGVEDVLSKKVCPDIIAVTATTSAEEIMDLLRPVETECLIVPFTNLKHPNWQYLD